MTAGDWDRAQRALTALAIDIQGLKGMIIRARPGPVLDALVQGFAAIPLPRHRLHPTVDDTRLFGGLNVAASLARRQPVRDPGLADLPSLIVLPMAERASSGLAARLGALLDASGDHALVLIDEGASEDEAAPEALADRLAFHAELSALPASTGQLRLPAPSDLDAARDRLPGVRHRPADIEELTVTAAHLGIGSLRAPFLALRCARALAALDGASAVGAPHLREAVELIYPSRATRLPEQAGDTPDPPPPEDWRDSARGDGAQDLPDDLLVAAVAALLPRDLLGKLERNRLRKGPQGGAGAGHKRSGNRRGRPLPSRPGRPEGRSRIDVVATLRAAAPWQPMRRKALSAPASRLIVLPPDIRLRRFEDRSDRLVIFAVDASGSAAMARMAEAKGAVELMLAQAYAKRDQVALVAFRGDTAEVLLPPTRSLVQAKRQLSTLPGGGGTPLAAGLGAALELAHHARRGGLSPMLAVLTDGRANIALDGSAGRDPARADAEAIARHWSAQDLPAVVIDTANRPGPEGAALAGWLGARYLALPRADARQISTAAAAALSG